MKFIMRTFLATAFVLGALKAQGQTPPPPAPTAPVSNSTATVEGTTAGALTVTPAKPTSQVAAPAADTTAKTTATETAVEPTESGTAVAVPIAKKTNEQRRLKRILAVLEVSIDDKPVGVVKAQLFPDKAPKTVTHFSDLVEGKKPFKEYDSTKGKLGELTSRPFYDGLTFHRIVTDYVVQGGCPLGNGRGGTGEYIDDEISQELRHNAPGILAMASSGRKNSNSSQFYITLKSLPHLDGKYTIFGKVIEGMDVINKVAQIKSDRMTQVPQQKAVMKTVKIVREYF